MRLLWLLVLVAGVVLATAAISAGQVPWPVVLLLSLAIGIAYGCLSFVAHETLHGSVVRSRWLQRLVGFVAFLPFVVSPRLWVAWHNRAHHGNTGRAGHDPDAYPTLADYQSSGSVRFVTDHFALGRRRAMGLLSLVLGFTGQSLQVLASAHRRGILSRSEQFKAGAETALGVAAWTTLAVFIDIPSFLCVFVLPLLVGNTIIMTFILTNHSLSPATETNDPLVNSLSVTAPRWVEWLTLRFGYHVEHHLFQAMSSRHAPLVRELIRQRWPERYQSMSLGSALGQLYRSPRVYKDDHTLVDPRTGAEWPLLRPASAGTFSSTASSR
jgi:fatty acid desaturase